MSNRNRIIWPGWETVRLIGRGSFGAVYEIERKLFEDDDEVEKAALKVISIPQNDSDIEEMYSDGYDEESITSTFHTHLKSIVAEYSLMRKMNGSANIVNCDDVRYVQHDDGIGWDIYIKMELLTPLAKALPATVSEEQVIKIAKDMCAALELCQKHSIIHRDIKPQNIFVSENGDYKLGDFGIAKTVEKTMGGTKTGTYKYMAPEVYSNRPYNSTADIYSLGLVLYWLLNERRMPFMPLPPEKLRAGMDEESRNRRFSGEKIPAPKNGSDELKQIVLKSCAFDPKDRYQTAREMREDLLPLSGDHASVQNVQNSIYAAQQEADNSDATVGPTFGYASHNRQYDAIEKTVGPNWKNASTTSYEREEDDKTVGPDFSTSRGTNHPPKKKKFWPVIATATGVVVVFMALAFFINGERRELPMSMGSMGQFANSMDATDDDTELAEQSGSKVGVQPEDPELLKPQTSGTMLNLTWKLKEDGTLRISGLGDMYWEGSEAPWYELRKQIMFVEISDGVTDIAEGAFNGCTNLTQISIPDSVSEIGAMAFCNCTNLCSITLPPALTSIAARVFYSCSSLTNIVIPDGVSSVGEGAFYGCSGLTTITIPDSVTALGENAFYYCTSLTDVSIIGDISDWGASTFKKCTSLTNLTIQEGVKMIGESAFEGCKDLINVKIPSGVIRIEQFSFWASGLKSITIPKSITYIGPYNLNGQLGSLEDIYYEGSELDWKSIEGTWEPHGPDYAIHYNCK